MEPFDDYIQKFNEAFKALQKLVPTVDSVDNLVTDAQKFEFVKYFRELLRIYNILTTFADFSFEKVAVDEQTFVDYKSKYLDIYDKVRGDREKEKVSILEDVDFELELLRRDEINVDYIISLLRNIKGTENEDEKKKRKKAVLDIVQWEPLLRSKKELIEKFIEENLSNIPDSDNVWESFEKFLSDEKNKEFLAFCQEENIDVAKFQKVIDNYLYTGKKPLNDEVISTLTTPPRLLQRATIIKRVIEKIKYFVEKFESV